MNQPNALITYALQTTTTTNNDTTTNSSLLVQVAINRTISWSANVHTSTGTHNMTWAQSIRYENAQNYSAAGSNETLWQATTGTALSQVVSSSNSTSTTDAPTDTDTDTALLHFYYPISFFQAYDIPTTDYTTTNSTLYAVLDRSKHETGQRTLTHLLYPPPLPSPSSSPTTTNNTSPSPSFLLSTRQNGSCFYLWNNTYYEDAGAIDPANGTLGATSQWFAWTGTVVDDGDATMTQKNYSRLARAVDGYEPVLTVDEVFDDDGRVALLAVPATEVVSGVGINVLPAPLLEEEEEEGT